jgi:hypothetical protein
MKRSNDTNPMSLEDFEKELKQRPMRQMPPEWRAEILAAAKTAAASIESPASVGRPSFLSAMQARLSAILWPHPKAWAGLAAVWGAILLLNFATGDRPETVAHKTSPSPEMMAVWKEQERTLVKLVEPFDQLPAVPAKQAVPRPRSERQSTAALA